MIFHVKKRRPGAFTATPGYFDPPERYEETRIKHTPLTRGVIQKT